MVNYKKKLKEKMEFIMSVVKTDSFVCLAIILLINLLILLNDFNGWFDLL